MREQQNMVREFHEKCGALISDKPILIDYPTRELRIALIREELAELGNAFDKHTNYKWELPAKENPEAVTEVADALGDLLYVILGAAVSCGIDMETVFAEIHRSNMTKFIDGHRREDGKWIKGPSYSPANLKPLLES